MPWLHGEDGPLDRRVSTTFEEGLQSEEVDAEAMRYWFTEPAGGWPTEKRRVRLLEQASEAEQGLGINAAHQDSRTRMPLTTLVEGVTVSGTVISQILHLGALVDIGAAHDGLIPLNTEDSWEAVGSRLLVGTRVEARVWRVRDPALFRFPVQLAPLDAELAAALPPPEAHVAPMDLRDQSMDLEKLAALSGRSYVAETYTFPTQDQLDEEEDGLELELKEEPVVLTPEEEEEMEAVAQWLLSI